MQRNILTNITVIIGVAVATSLASSPAMAHINGAGGAAIALSGVWLATAL